MSESPIASIELFHVGLPPRREHKWTGLQEPIGGYIILKMTDGDGRAGWGEAPALKDWGGEFGRYYGESPGTVRAVVSQYLGPAVAGCLPGQIVELHARMDRALNGHPYAKAAVEIAAYDLAGLQLNVPSFRLLGGAVRRRIAVTHSIGLVGFQEAEREAAQAAREGIRTFKIKVGVDPDRDVEMVLRIRDTVGPKLALCIDANQGYATQAEAIRTFRRIDAPVMADESAWTAHDVLRIAETRAAQLVSIYTTKPGGLFRAMEVAAVARAAGIVCNVNGSLETGIGNRANIALAAAAPAATLSCVVPVSTPAEAQSGQVAGIYYKDDLIAAPMRFAEGCIEVQDLPGLGIAVDEEKVRRYLLRDV
jgi:muconate cycloisomerase